MSPAVTTGVVVAATAVHGLLAGGNFERLFVQMPAWHRVGAKSLAAFSRHADLARGIFVYPVEAIGGTILTIAAVFSFRHDPHAPSSAAAPIYLTAALAIGGLLVTTQAAPRMLSLRRLPDEDVDGLQAAFDGFEFWSRIRAVCQILAFAANLWALVALGGGR